MLAFALFPELHSRLKVRDTKHVVQLFSPARIIRLFRYPNLVLIVSKLRVGVNICSISFTDNP